MSSEKKDHLNQSVSGAFPAEQSAVTVGGLNVDLTAEGLAIFNPNFALSAVQTFNTMNTVANEMFGIEAIWFRAVPQQRSKDVIFQEYTLSCVEDTPLCIKVVVPDGNMPESNYQYDLMGLEYQVPTEIQIDKRYWEKEAGFGTAPQKKDIVYLPLPNKLFQVESSYLKRSFMEQETTWVINLIKYQPEASRKEGPKLKETIDKYTVSEESLFGMKIEGDIEKLTDKKQMSPLSSTSEDQYKEIDKTLKIIPYNLDIHGIVVAESAYDLATSTLFNAVTYKNSDDLIKINCDRSITAWVNSKVSTNKEYDLLPLTGTYFYYDSALTPPANYKIKIAGTKRYAMGDSFIFYRSEQLNLYGKVVDDNEAASGIYYIVIDQPVIDHLNSIDTLWYKRKGWKAKIKDPIFIIDGINETADTGFAVTLNADQYIKINYGTQEQIAVLPTRIDPANWYGFVINIGNTWQQYNVHVWKPNPLDTTSKLQSVFYETLPFTPEETQVERYSIDKSDAYITNIRFFNSTIEEEKQVEELLSYFSRNADKALILDNCDPRFRAPYISQQR